MTPDPRLEGVSQGTVVPRGGQAEGRLKVLDSLVDLPPARQDEAELAVGLRNCRRQNWNMHFKVYIPSLTPLSIHRGPHTSLDFCVAQSTHYTYIRVAATFSLPPPFRFRGCTSSQWASRYGSIPGKGLIIAVYCKTSRCRRSMSRGRAGSGDRGTPRSAFHTVIRTARKMNHARLKNVESSQVL